MQLRAARRPDPEIYGMAQQVPGQPPAARHPLTEPLEHASLGLAAHAAKARPPHKPRHFPRPCSLLPLNRCIRVEPTMSRLDDRSYFVERARQERALASNSSDSTAALVHARMAEEYERRARAMDRSDPSQQEQLTH